MNTIDIPLKREIDFHEKKFESGEDFSYIYKNDPLWKKQWERKFENIYAPLKELKQDAHILNVGAGTGPVEYFLSRENKIYKNFISSDISKNAISNIKYLNLNDNLLICDAIALPFKDSSFDVVLFIGVLHHIPKEDFNKLFYEVQRVIKPNGFVIASEPPPNVIRKIIRIFYTKWKDIHSEDEKEVEWIELKSLKSELQIDDIIIKPQGLFIDLLINVKINKYIAKILQYLYIFDIFFEKLHISWSYFIYIKFNKYKIDNKLKGAIRGKNCRERL